MSLILEALKKSEQQRRLGEAPNLGTPVLAVRRRRNLLPAFAALIVIALGAGWWLWRTPTTPVATDTPKPAVADRTPPKSVAANPAMPRAAKPASDLGARHDLAKPAEPPSAAARNDRTAVTAAAPRAPIPAPTRPLAAPAPATATAPVAATAKPDAVKPTDATKPAIATTTTPSAVTPTPAAPATNAAPKSASAAAPPTAAAAPAKANLPTVWELPYATRKDIPEFALTMHVYASNPQERFVVIKGERHAEGDDLGDGLVLKEISADGMILDYKGQRFVYPRDGR